VKIHFCISTFVTATCLQDAAAVATLHSCLSPATYALLEAACRTLKHLPASLLELEYDWEPLWESAPAVLDLRHLTALTKLSTGEA
jgi:hypothetical protein